MKWRLAFIVIMAGLAWGIASQGFVQAQDAADDQLGVRTEPRALAPGVMTTIPVETKVEETVTRRPIVELAGFNDPDQPTAASLARIIDFRRDIWCLEFSFKPIRFVEVDLPAEGGSLRRVVVWYMLYSVKNTGQTLHPVPDLANPQEFGETGETRYRYDVEEVAEPIRFIPHMILATEDSRLAYPDQVIPAAVPVIRRREDPARTFYHSQNISNEPLEPDETRWGVATWEGVDPTTDRFSINITGLSNAYQWEDAEGSPPEDAPPGSARRLPRKVLKLNFWRPGDEFHENEQEIRYGAPGEVDYEWVYRYKSGS